MKSSPIYNFFTSYDIVTSILPAIRALNDSDSKLLNKQPLGVFLDNYIESLKLYESFKQYVVYASLALINWRVSRKPPSTIVSRS